MALCHDSFIHHIPIGSFCRLRVATIFNCAVCRITRVATIAFPYVVFVNWSDGRGAPKHITHNLTFEICLQTAADWTAIDETSSVAPHALNVLAPDSIALWHTTNRDSTFIMHHEFVI
jgi:hypothetical protein